MQGPQRANPTQLQLRVPRQQTNTGELGGGCDSDSEERTQRIDCVVAAEHEPKANFEHSKLSKQLCEQVKLQSYKHRSQRVGCKHGPTYRYSEK